MKPTPNRNFTHPAASGLTVVWGLLALASFGLPYIKITVQQQSSALRLSTTYPGQVLLFCCVALVAAQLWLCLGAKKSVWLKKLWLATALVLTLHLVGVYWNHTQLLQASTVPTLAQQLALSVQLLLPFYGNCLLALGAAGLAFMPQLLTSQYHAKNTAQ